ncbi:hypothetical protein A1O3_01953 [Capronia epimyces CBS 606.96]|uniref:AB hydrolase-1 domain-containing protein n=1 Tax=Capronia epimyces CBS 606.96 TaxID=1182542 RepID=W9Z323_9EURO|nr:uncharacterized protein A1O3_01953 [Capronia epimyces CBS 606.96]EXJ88889.1 hypothetical protein A1O3_01953 [Capronia epimyces CBS 606.96]
MPPAPTYDATGIEYYEIPDFAFSNGTTLHDVRVAYRSYNAASSGGVVLIPTCFAGLINSTLTFTGGPNDALAGYHVVVVAMLGNSESSSASNKAFFPAPGELQYSDVVRAQHQLLTQHLGVQSLEAVVGFSMGGQQAYHWAVMYPGFAKRVVAICSSARTSLHNYAFLEGPVAALTNSIDYVAWRAMKDKAARGEAVGVNLKEVVPKRGLRAFARAYAAWLTSAAWFRERAFTSPAFGVQTVEDWILAREQAYLLWDAEDLLVLARMWQMGDVGSVGAVGGCGSEQEQEQQGEENHTPSASAPVSVSQLGGAIPNDDLYIKALQSIQARVLLMPCRTDQYFPPEDSEMELKYLKHGQLAVIESSWGHMAGGGVNPKDVQFMNEQIAQFLKD